MKKYKKKTYRKRPYRRRYLTTTRRSTKPRNQITSAIFRYADPTLIENKVNSTVGEPNAGHIAPAVTDMPGSLPYKNLFSQFRVCKVKIEFIPVQRINLVAQISGNTTMNEQTPMFATHINRVATSFPQDYEEIMSTSGVKYCAANKKCVRYFTPVTFDTIFVGSFSTEGLAPEYKQWISTNYFNVAHHGCSYVMSAASNIPEGTYKYQKVITMYCQFKNRRVNTDNQASSTYSQSFKTRSQARIESQLESKIEPLSVDTHIQELGLRPATGSEHVDPIARTSEAQGERSEN
eukprot:COSAG01_NODE_11630_length_1892_cov_7.590630_2_plen_292_part_00